MIGLHGSIFSGKGRPDLLVLDGVYATLLEVKSKVGHIDPAQEGWIGYATRQGHSTHVVQSKEQAEAAVRHTRREATVTDFDLSFLEGVFDPERDTPPQPETAAADESADFGDILTGVPAGVTDMQGAILAVQEAAQDAAAEVALDIDSLLSELENAPAVADVPSPSDEAVRLGLADDEPHVVPYDPAAMLAPLNPPVAVQDVRDLVTALEVGDDGDPIIAAILPLANLLRGLYATVGILRGDIIKLQQAQRAATAVPKRTRRTKAEIEAEKAAEAAEGINDE